jgi:hypothetical protein
MLAIVASLLLLVLAMWAWSELRNLLSNRWDEDR